MVNFEITCIQSGRRNTGNQAPPIAEITKIKSVAIPFAWFNDFANEVIIIPNETAAADDAIITKNKLPKFENISTLKTAQANRNIAIS